jgi:hypothetical protein
LESAVKVETPGQSAQRVGAESDFGHHDFRPAKQARIQAGKRHGIERQLDILSTKLGLT